MDLSEIENEYFPLKINGMSYSEMRKQLGERGLDDQGINILIRSIDNKILIREKQKANSRRSKEAFWMGSILLGIGIVLTVGTYIGGIDLGDSYVIAVGPILAGGSLLGFSSIKSNKFK